MARRGAARLCKVMIDPIGNGSNNSRQIVSESVAH